VSADVDLVRGLVEAFTRLAAGDASALSEATDPLDPDIVWYGTVGGLDEQHVYRGKQAVAEAAGESLATWEKLVLEAERYIDAGDGRVVVYFHEIARTRHSSVEIEDRTAVIYTVRNERIVEVRAYMNRDEALEAAGVSL